ncbi:MAG: hypothetical protein EOR68_04070 [Mesorhizobium sp.]|uniref:hypothetical protein n=1 Tax=Mesorhizobium sp. TaxID=1871066 RepID=UPI000FE6B262|nr:hypothetical protein [Mesorhizobium sp.]RWM04088.1 MAG: hypothetical protein EOR68_04070 [Mesorhizobium sp.]
MPTIWRLQLIADGIKTGRRRNDLDPRQVAQDAAKPPGPPAAGNSPERKIRTQEHEELAGDQGNPQQGAVLAAVLHRLSERAGMRFQHISPDGWKVRSLASLSVAGVDKPRDGISH